MSVVPITPQESFLIQSHALVECLVRLGQLEMAGDPRFLDLSSHIYGRTARMILNDDPKRSIFQGQGVLLTVLYLLLVMPKELLGNKEGGIEGYDLSNAEKAARDNARNPQTSYPKGKKTLSHFRNALAHARFCWTDDNYLQIRDFDPKTENTYSAEFSMESLGLIAQELNTAFTSYVESALKRRSAGRAVR